MNTHYFTKMDIPGHGYMSYLIKLTEDNSVYLPCHRGKIQRHVLVGKELKVCKEKAIVLPDARKAGPHINVIPVDKDLIIVDYIQNNVFNNAPAFAILERNKETNLMELTGVVSRLSENLHTGMSNSGVIHEDKLYYVSTNLHRNKTTLCVLDYREQKLEYVKDFDKVRRNPTVTIKGDTLTIEGGLCTDDKYLECIEKISLKTLKKTKGKKHMIHPAYADMTKHILHLPTSDGGLGFNVGPYGTNFKDQNIYIGGDRKIIQILKNDIEPKAPIKGIIYGKNKLILVEVIDDGHVAHYTEKLYKDK